MPEVKNTPDIQNSGRSTTAGTIRCTAGKSGSSAPQAAPNPNPASPMAMSQANASKGRSILNSMPNAQHRTEQAYTNTTTVVAISSRQRTGDHHVESADLRVDQQRLVGGDAGQSRGRHLPKQKEGNDAGDEERHRRHAGRQRTASQRRV